MRRPLALLAHISLVLTLFALVDLSTLFGNPKKPELLLHLVVSLLLAYSALLYMQWHPSLRLLLLCLVFFLCLPLFAPIFSAAFLITHFLSRPADVLGGFHEVDEGIAKNMKIDDTKGYEQSLQERVNVEPIVDTIRSDAPPDRKRRAIEALTDLETPHAVSLLKECLDDANSEVRFYASSGLSRIEERMNRDIICYKKKVEAGDVTLENLFRLGRAYYEVVNMGIQDRKSLKYYLDQSLLHLSRASDHPDAQQEVHINLEKALTLAGRTDEVLQLHSRHFGGEQTNIHHTLYLAENHFNEGRFSDCRKIILHAPSNQNPHWFLEDIRQLWTKNSQVTS
ncbi:MAG: HEAT repeat domain-containing protein [Planctomycetes bacterium]|nr:HEAT repeat domain-containing protein [Planctomycetota bacterium]